MLSQALEAEIEIFVHQYKDLVDELCLCFAAKCFVACSRHATANEIMLQVVQYIGGEPTDSVLWDFTAAARVKITTMEIKGIADSLKKKTTDRKTRKVALVESKTINIGMGKLFVASAQLSMLHNIYKSFRDMDGEWLEGQSADD